MHTVRFSFQDGQFQGVDGYAIGLCAKEARVWCTEQGLVEEVDFTYHSEIARLNTRYIDWVFTFRDVQPATLFKIRFSNYL